MTFSEEIQEYIVTQKVPNYRKSKLTEIILWHQTELKLGIFLFCYMFFLSNMKIYLHCRCPLQLGLLWISNWNKIKSV